MSKYEFKFKLNLIILFLHFTIFSLALCQTCTTDDYNCYEQTLPNLVLTRNQLIEKMLNYTSIMNEVNANLQTFKNQYLQKVLDIQNNFTDELNSYIKSEILYNHDTYQPDLRSYYIIEVTSGLCLTFEGNSVQLSFTTCTYNMSQNQLWNFYSYETGSWGIWSQAQYLVDNLNYNSNDGNIIRAYTYGNNTAQMWQTQYNTDNNQGFKILNDQNKMCLQYNPSTNLCELWTCNTTGEQTFRIEVADI